MSDRTLLPAINAITALMRSTRSVVTSSAASASNGTLLAENTSRRGASFFNDCDKAAYVKCGAVATTSSFTHKMAAAEYWEIPFGYVGVVDALWEAGPTGSMRVTEFL